MDCKGVLEVVAFVSQEQCMARITGITFSPIFVVPSPGS